MKFVSLVYLYNFFAKTAKNAKNRVPGRPGPPNLKAQGEWPPCLSIVAAPLHRCMTDKEMGSVWGSVKQLTCLHDLYFFVLNDMEVDCDSGCCSCSCRTNKVEEPPDSDTDLSGCCCEYTSTSSGQ